MTKTFLLFIVLFACACNNQADKTSSDQAAASSESATPKKDSAASTSAASSELKEKALGLIAGSDCLTCHKVDEKLTGPAYRDVANKYSADDQTINMLVQKVIKGGSGVWGTIPMTPHPALKEEDVKTMVTYILSLKQK